MFCAGFGVLNASCQVFFYLSISCWEDLLYCSCMIFIWLALIVGIAVLAALIEAVATEVREEHDEVVSKKRRRGRVVKK